MEIVKAEVGTDIDWKCKIGQMYVLPLCLEGSWQTIVLERRIENSFMNKSNVEKQTTQMAVIV